MTGLQHPFMADETSLIRLTIMCTNRYQTPSLTLFRRSLQTTPATLLFEALDLWFCYPLADQSHQSTFAKHRNPSAGQYADPWEKNFGVKDVGVEAGLVVLCQVIEMPGTSQSEGRSGNLGLLTFKLENDLLAISSTNSIKRSSLSGPFSAEPAYRTTG